MAPADVTARRLSVIIQDLERGGTELQLLELLPRLMKLGWELKLYTLVPVKGLSDSFRAAGVEIVEPRRLSWVPARIRRLAQIVMACVALSVRFRFQPPGLLVGVLPAGSIAAGLLGYFCRFQYMVLRRSRNFYQEKRPYVTCLERALCRRAVVAGNSPAVAADLRAEGVPAESVVCIPNGVDAARFNENRTAARTALGLGDNAFVLLCLANLIKYKGHADLLAALASIKDQMPAHWTLLLAGRDNGIGESLKYQAIQSGISDNIQFLGVRSDVPTLLAAADIGILASHEEGFSNSVLEGMAAGLPMIVTDVGGNAEAVDRGRAGMVVPPRDPQALGSAIAELTHDAARRGALGEAARMRAVKHYSLEASAEAHSALFEAVLLKRPIPADLR